MTVVTKTYIVFETTFKKSEKKPKEMYARESVFLITG